MRKALLFIGFAVLATAVSAAPLVKVAFMGLEPVQVSESAASGISESFLNELINTNRFTLVERDRINSLLEEQGLSISGCTTTECYVQVGQLTGAEKVLVGKLSKVENAFILNVRIVDVYTGTIELSESEKAYSLDSLLSQTRGVAQRLAAKIPVTGTVISVGADTIKIDMGLQEGVTTGTDLVVFRYGEEYYHPDTGLLLGRDVEELGHVTITKVLANELSEAQLVGPFSPRVGDKVRLAGLAIVVTPVVEPVVTTPEVKPVTTPEVTPAVVDNAAEDVRFTLSTSVLLDNMAFVESSPFESENDMNVSTIGFAVGFGFVCPISDYILFRNNALYNMFITTVEWVDYATVEFSQAFIEDVLDFWFFLGSKPLKSDFALGLGAGISGDFWFFFDEGDNSFLYDSYIGVEFSMITMFGGNLYLRLLAHLNTSASYTYIDNDSTFELTGTVPMCYGLEFGVLL